MLACFDNGLADAHLYGKRHKSVSYKLIVCLGICDFLSIFVPKYKMSDEKNLVSFCAKEDLPS